MHLLRAAGSFLVLLSGLQLCAAVAVAAMIVWWQGRPPDAGTTSAGG